VTCLDENKVVEFIQGLLAPEARVAIEAHLDECPSCRQLMAELARLSFSHSSREALAPTLPPVDIGSGTASVRTPTGSRELLPAQVLAGRFRIVRRIGRGSFGNVYEAEDLQLEDRVALKLLRPEVRDNPGLLGHLHHEIVVGRRISHPHVCRIYDLGTCEDFHFISMALVPGQGLDRYLERGLPPLEKAHTILVQICEALEAAHQQGVVHRDLKPSNIMVHDDPQGALNITVMDFGLARDLRAGPSLSGVLIGSPAYWSPEQARGGGGPPRGGQL
jgi:serine/threonine protein kinase